MMQKYQDSSLSPEERASDLLAQMNLDEKFGQIQCYNAIDSFLGKSVEKQNPYGVGQVCILIATMLDDVGSAAGLIARLQKQIMESGEHHIPAIFHIEALTGVMVTAATSFPCGLGQASTWDPEQQQKMAACIARQGRAMGISHALAPVFDICRDPRFGRMGETYGEDPTLAAAMGTAYVKGLQDKHRMSACSKHFLGFMAGQGGIHTAQAVVSPRELREVYAKPFQAAITEGKLDSVMNSYAAIDGQAAAGQRNPRPLAGQLNQLPDGLGKLRLIGPQPAGEVRIQLGHIVIGRDLVAVALGAGGLFGVENAHLGAAPGIVQPVVGQDVSGSNLQAAAWVRPDFGLDVV